MAEKGYVFISYSSKENTFVKQLTDMMDKNNMPYWKAPEMIPAGSNYAREIPQAINKCEIFLLVLSAASQESIWIEKEVDVAICYRKKVIPVKIDDEPLNDLYRFYLNNVQMINAVVEEGQILNLEQIQQRLSQIILENEAGADNGVVVEKNSKIQKANRPDKRSNALRVNKIPLECGYCGGAVEQSSLGVYICQECGKENYDDFQKIRNYLETVGAAPVAVISRNTGVSYKTIEHFWNEEFLEIPKTIDVRMACGRCGAAIRTGILCDKCKRDSMEQSKNNFKGVWHSKSWKK